MKVLYKRQKPSKNTTKVESGLTDFHKMNVIVVKVHYKRKKNQKPSHAEATKPFQKIHVKKT